MAEKKSIGKVTHYFDKAKVAVVSLEAGGKLKVGDRIHFQGNSTDFDQTVDSLQIDHADVESVKAGDSFGMKVDQPVREGDAVYLAG